MDSPRQTHKKKCNKTSLKNRQSIPRMPAYHTKHCAIYRCSKRHRSNREFFLDKTVENSFHSINLKKSGEWHMNTNYHYIITTFTSRENVSDVDVKRSFKNRVNLSRLGKCPQKGTDRRKRWTMQKETNCFLFVCKEAKLKFRIIT